MRKTGLSVLEIQILVRLVSGSKTAEQLQKNLSANYAELLLALKKLVLKKRIERKKGYPTCYKLSDSSMLLAKKLRAKHDMSDLLSDPCSISVPASMQKE
ncbi:hypothetical protein KKE06_03545 [Candidatus Micrarchaeota archaeon]|nr:hypothetical protein [Candidatus Micrarchaeota archaeon]MBU1930871.1 hypothetical protein [Candidatus Micrarchaeota archaeon]